MNSKEIIEIISHYLTQSRLNTAILIDGEWGSGKTYFVQNELIDAICSLKQDNKPFVPVYISLYGVEKTSDIGKEMFNKTIFSFKPKTKTNEPGHKKNKKNKIVKYVGDYLAEAAKGTAKSMVQGLFAKGLGFELVLPEINDYLPYVDETRIVLILDDLERSKIDIIELFGYINNFVEEYGIKTIIVGNENEIRKKFTSENLISKYDLVKNLILPISKEEKSLSFSPYLKSEDKKTPVKNGELIETDIETLNSQIQYLFPNPNSYELTKEKLIGFTIEYTPNLEEIFEVLAIDKIEKQTLKSVYEIFNRKKCTNIRTFLFGLDMYEKILPVINNQRLANKQEVTKYITEEIFELSISVKDKRHSNGFNIIEYLNFSLKDEGFISEEISSLIKKEVNRFLNTSIINKDNFTKILLDTDGAISKKKEIINSKQKNSLNDLQTTWVNLDDNDLQERMQKTVEIVRSGPADLNTYKSLICYLYLYNKIFVDQKINVKEIVDTFVKKISEISKPLTNDEHWFPPISFKDENIVKEIEAEFSRLEVAKDKRNKDLLKTMASDDSKSDKWLENLIICLDSKDTVSRVEKRSVLGYLDIEQLLVNIEKCTISELNDFYYRFLQKNYDFNNIGDYYSNDVSNVEELISGLDKIMGKLKQAEGKRIFCFVLSEIKKYLEEDILVRLKR